MILTTTISGTTYTYTFERDPEFGDSLTFDRNGNVHIDAVSGDVLFKHTEDYIIRSYTVQLFDLSSFLTFEEIVLGKRLTLTNYDGVINTETYLILKDIVEMGEDTCLDGTKRILYNVSFDLVSLI